MAATHDTLSKEELRRYARQIIVPEVGTEGQRKLKKGRVLCVGAGGLGSPVSLYLAAAGVGTIGLVDFDTVDLSNLHRQILYSTEEQGRSKIQIAAAKLKALNPNVNVTLFDCRFTAANAMEVVRDFDVIVDGSDNFPTRYLVNDACVMAEKPNVYGSIFRFEGQVSVFWSLKGPCYRCLYPEPPPEGFVPSCAEGGVLGVLPGIIGTLQALEAIKLILEKGKPLIGRLVIFDAMDSEWRAMKVKKNPNCPICGLNPTIRTLTDLRTTCAPEVQGSSLSQISSAELLAKRTRDESFVLLDVREQYEYEIAKIEGSILIPLNSLPQRFGELDASREIVVYCKMGGRSAKAVEFLRKKGFNAVNLSGGIDAWSREVDPTVPTY